MVESESTPEKGRDALIAAVERGMRESSALGTMFSQSVAVRVGLTPSDLECLDFIGFRGRVTAGDLARATGLTTGAITAVIDRLEKAGFAKRERDPGDRRRVYVVLRPVAMKRLERYYAPLAARAAARFQGYSDKELELLVKFFAWGREVMAASIEELTHEPGKRAKRNRPGA